MIDNRILKKQSKKYFGGIFKIVGSKLICTRVSVFIERMIRKRTRRSENKEIVKFVIRRSCRNYVLCQVNLLRSTASYRLFSRKKQEKVSRNFHTMEQSRQGANQATLPKGNISQDHNKSSTEWSSLFRERAKFSGTETLIPSVP